MLKLAVKLRPCTSQQKKNLHPFIICFISSTCHQLLNRQFQGGTSLNLPFLLGWDNGVNLLSLLGTWLLLTQPGWLFKNEGHLASVANFWMSWTALFYYRISLFAGKVGGFIASIPDVMVAALLCFMWAMLAALGLSNLRYSEAGSSRNIIIVGLSLFFSLSIPAYFQQYGISPNSNSSVPSYFQPYIVASHGPFRSNYGGVCS